MKLLKTNQLNSGFTLLESLIAIAIFTTSILALLSILANGISSTTYAKRKIVASYLAEEGVERVRNIRDNQVLFDPGGQAGWDAFKGLVDSTCANGCYLTDANAFVQCDVSCPPLKYDANTGRYNYTTGEDAGYVRMIKVAEPLGAAGDERKISSTVSWVQGSGEKEIVFSESLFNWIE